MASFIDCTQLQRFDQSTYRAGSVSKAAKRKEHLGCFLSAGINDCPREDNDVALTLRTGKANPMLACTREDDDVALTLRLGKANPMLVSLTATIMNSRQRRRCAGRGVALKSRRELLREDHSYIIHHSLMHHCVVLSYGGSYDSTHYSPRFISITVHKDGQLCFTREF
jgi:hypothetical protein